MNLPELRKDLQSIPPRDHATAQWVLGFSTAAFLCSGTCLAFSIQPIAAVLMFLAGGILAAVSWWMAPPREPDIRDVVTRLTAKDHASPCAVCNGDGGFKDEITGDLFLCPACSPFNELGRQPSPPASGAGERLPTVVPGENPDAGETTQRP